MAVQDEYRAKAKEALDKLQTQIDELRVQADLAQAEVRDRLEKAVDALRDQRRQAQARLDDAGKAGAGAWKSAAGQVEEAVDGLGDTFSKLADEVQAAVGAGGSAAKKSYSAFLDEWKKARAERKALLDK
jgi:uncharacterized phage infection (PIP) family protein YhgE